MRKGFLLLIIFLSVMRSMAQDDQVLNFEEYLGYVKAYHPVARQAELQISAGQANLMKARGGFDPQLELDYERKEFKGTEYFDKLNATFKVPTWFGIEVKGNFEQNEGDFLNPSDIVPENGLYSAGVKVPLGQGLWINKRMATLRQAKLFREQTKADRDLAVNAVLFEASRAYFSWLQAYRDLEVYKDFLSNAEIRLEGIRRSANAGDIAAIDTVEATIAVQNRKLSLEQAEVAYFKKSMDISNFLWIADNIPMELQPYVIPDIEVDYLVNSALELQEGTVDSFELASHPKLRSLDLQIKGIEVDKRLMANRLLPQVDLEYNFLTETPELLRSLNNEMYKGSINIRFPLFLRKERGELQLAKFKLKDARYEFDNAEIEIRNKIRALNREIESYIVQNQLIASIVKDYRSLFMAEERKFSFGESSLFLVNSRENKLIESELKRNEVQNKFLNAKANLFRTLAINPNMELME